MALECAQRRAKLSVSRAVCVCVRARARARGRAGACMHAWLGGWLAGWKTGWAGGPGCGVLADGCQQLAADLKIPTCLADLGLSLADTEVLATEAMKVTRLLQNNMREITRPDALSLYQRALHNT